MNVARALRLLGRPVIATGFVGGRTGERIVDLLAEEDVLNDFVRTQGESRTNIVLVDPTSGERTELNERGPEVANEELERFVDRLLYLTGGAEFCVIAGSIPPGIVPEIYGRMIEELQRHGVPCLLDTDGEPMRAGLRAEPAVVAPNAAEAEEAVGHEFNDPGDYLLGLKCSFPGADHPFRTRGYCNRCDAGWKPLRPANPKEFDRLATAGC